MTEENLKYLISIHEAVNLTFLRFRSLKSYFKNDWEKVWNAKISDWKNAGIDKQGIENFFAKKDKIMVGEMLEKIYKIPAQILIYGEENYPISLENIYNPPPILLVRGKLTNADVPSVSVVGSRNISNYGKRALEKIVAEIAQAKITIVSGLAFGADFLAHETAIKNKTRTIAVLGNAIDGIFPKNNQYFAEKFLAENQGVILSEYLPESKTRPENFPVRNRIVSGLSRIIIVAEAAIKSGSLITAKLAIDQNKEIFAIPGEIFSKNSIGTNKLIADGEASLIHSGRQVLDCLGISKTNKTQTKLDLPTVGIEAEILKFFNEEKIHIDDLARNTNFPASTINANISLLEIKGLVKCLGNQIYVKNF